MPRKILIIEDDPSISMMFGTALKHEGYDVVAAPDAVVALTVARQEKPDLILLDLALPGGTGLQVLERLRSTLHTAITPVIVVTASGVADKPTVLSKGAQAFLEKPVDLEELFEVVAGMIGPRD